MLATIPGLWWDQDGLTTVEYALLLALVALAAVAAWGDLGCAVTRSARHAGHYLRR